VTLLVTDRPGSVEFPAMRTPHLLSRGSHPVVEVSEQ
jgi:hypothetical protein